MAVLTIPKVLREKLSEEGADALVDIINKANESKKQNILTLVEEKFERQLAEEIGKLKAEMIKWMFIFWIGQIAVLTSIMLTIFKR